MGVHVTFLMSVQEGLHLVRPEARAFRCANLLNLDHYSLSPSEEVDADEVSVSIGACL